MWLVAFAVNKTSHVLCESMWSAHMLYSQEIYEIFESL